MGEKEVEEWDYLKIFSNWKMVYEFCYCFPDISGEYRLFEFFRIIFFFFFY